MRCAGTDERGGTGGRAWRVRTDERGRRSQGHGSDLVLRVDLPEAAEEEARRRRVDALTDARSRPDGDARANDSRLLRDVPPHW